MTDRADSSKENDDKLSQERRRKTQYSNDRSAARRFIKDKANWDDLQELLDLIQERISGQ
ncbi:hypothetical protein [Lactiplantibacillus plantarum]|uniref:hypothetical protein n=1 Tax=Lactiplantibacillus plantarum TaxID=1590 RepID=UPI001BA8B561|nr:hypothetical protein [Lactiplantibacillus plantarum]MBS0938053.1 hypothetical protein [Lactiplantibacillus plantarum]MBS0946049.1 hypothetical protein [Lactiplantibacillus plantarum]